TRILARPASRQSGDMLVDVPPGIRSSCSSRRHLVASPCRRGVAALRAAILIALGTGLLTLSAKINLPLPYVPMTLQTLVVLMIGAAYGARLGAATIMVYLVEGAIGLPVFAGPAGGL